MKKNLRLFAPKFLSSGYHLALAYLGALWFGFPSRKMTVIAVIGTRGKTTTANLIWSCLTAAGHKTGLTGTANIRIGDREFLNPYHMTMPGRFVLQKLLSDMKRAGCEYAVVETPSEGVEQWRHKGILYDAAVLSVVYPEYAEAHGWSFERCKRMHLEVFKKLAGGRRKILNGKKIPKTIVVNADSDFSEDFIRCEADNKITYGIEHNADCRGEGIRVGPSNITFRVGKDKYELRIRGAFNVPNALAAVALCSALGIEQKAIARGLSRLKCVPGRMESIEAGQPFSVLVDYAHDPVSIEAALRAVHVMKKSGSSKVILLFGATGGGRDKKRRPLMGRLAAELADFVIVSNDDPYDDDPREILEDVVRGAEKAGAKRGEKLFIIEDRRAGMAKAFSLAREGDIVLIAGKGAEQSMMMSGGREIAWDDRVVAREEIGKRANI